MTAHTPGPWTVGPSEDGRPNLAINWAGSGSERSSCGYEAWGELATVWGSDSNLPGVNSEAIANARLISSSPEMLEALLAMRRARACPIVDDDFPALIQKADRLMDAAIAKATGIK